MVRTGMLWTFVPWAVGLAGADFSLYPTVDESLLAQAFGITVDCLDAL